jgi:magnesium-transporting ATPase (P-type)
VLLFVFGLLIFVFSFYLAQMRVVDVVITPDMLASMAFTAGVDPATMTDERFRAVAVQLSAQTALVTFFVMTGLLAMLFADPPLPWFAGGSDFHRRNWLLLAAALGLGAVYLAILFLPGLRSIFQLVPLSMTYVAGLAVLTILWALLLRWFWRSRWLLRFLDMKERDGVEAK